MLFFIHSFIYIPSAVAQSIIRKISTNENDKAIEIWYRLNVEFANDTISMSQVRKWHKLLKKMAMKKVKKGGIVCDTSQKLKLLH